MCLGYFDEDKSRWICQDDCPTKTGDVYCGDTGTLTIIVLENRTLMKSKRSPHFIRSVAWLPNPRMWYHRPCGGMALARVYLCSCHCGGCLHSTDRDSNEMGGTGTRSRMDITKPNAKEADNEINHNKHRKEQKCAKIKERWRN